MQNDIDRIIADAREISIAALGRHDDEGALIVLAHTCRHLARGFSTGYLRTALDREALKTRLLEGVTAGPVAL